MTPAPITPRRAGTASNSRAFQESMMDLLSCGTFLSWTGVEPRSQHRVLGLQGPSHRRPARLTENPVPRRADCPCPCMPITPFALNKAVIPPVMVLTTDARRFCMAARSRRQTADLDAMDHVRTRPWRADTARRTRAAPSRGCIPRSSRFRPERQSCRPVFFHSSTQATLSLFWAGANRGGMMARGTTADHDDVVEIAHTPSTMRAGSSRHCLTVTRNCTASRPSMMR